MGGRKGTGEPAAESRSHEAEARLLQHPGRLLPEPSGHTTGETRPLENAVPRDASRLSRYAEQSRHMWLKELCLQSAPRSFRMS